jgi:hypothetical protein
MGRVLQLRVFLPRVLAPARCAEMDMNSLMRRVPEWISCHAVAQAAVGEHEIETIDVVYGEDEQFTGGQITCFGLGKRSSSRGRGAVHNMAAGL